MRQKKDKKEEEGKKRDTPAQLLEVSVTHTSLVSLAVGVLLYFITGMVLLADPAPSL